MKKYTHTIIFLLLTIGIGCAVFGIYFFADKTKKALDKQQQIKLEHEIQSEQIQNLPELAKIYQSIVAKEQVFSFLYSEERIVEIIKDIERIAKEEGVLLSITQKEVQKKKAKDENSEEGEEEEKALEDSLPYEKQVRLDLKAEGQYMAVRKFLHRLETAPYALDVLSVSITLAPKDENDPNRGVVTNSGNPFLLGGSVTPENEATTPVRSDKIMATFGVALYTQ